MRNRLKLSFKAILWLILISIPSFSEKVLISPYLNRFYGFAQFTSQELVIQESLKMVISIMPFIAILWTILITYILFGGYIRKFFMKDKEEEKEDEI